MPQTKQPTVAKQSNKAETRQAVHIQQTPELRSMRGQNPAVIRRTLNDPRSMNAGKIAHLQRMFGNQVLSKMNSSGEPLSKFKDSSMRSSNIINESHFIGAGIVQRDPKLTPQEKAVNYVLGFEKLSSGTPAFKGISKSVIVASLLSRIRNPSQIDQASLNACGPAAFAFLFAQDDPLKFAEFVIGLYQFSVGKFGNVTVTASEALRHHPKNVKNWPASAGVKNELDWMILASLRNDENAVLPFRDSSTWDASGITFPGEIKDWFKGVYRYVEDDTNLVFTKDINHLKNSVDKKQKKGYKCVLLINAAMLSPESVEFEESKNEGFWDKAKKDVDKAWKKTKELVPDHYVVYMGSLSIGKRVKFNVWTWGTTLTVDIPVNHFNKLYYGAICAKR